MTFNIKQGATDLCIPRIWDDKLMNFLVWTKENANQRVFHLSCGLVEFELALLQRILRVDASFGEFEWQLVSALANF